MITLTDMILNTNCCETKELYKLTNNGAILEPMEIVYKYELRFAGIGLVIYKNEEDYNNDEISLIYIDHKLLRFYDINGYVVAEDFIVIPEFDDIIKSTKHTFNIPTLCLDEELTLEEEKELLNIA